MSGGRAGLGLACLAWLGGCGLPEADFRDARNEAHCELLIRCYPAVYASLDECVGDWGATPPAPTCTYDEAAGESCVTELAELECPEAGAIPVLPAACGAVYTDCVTSE